jgi:membrane-bound lytic murein transglycosylase B
MRYRFVQWSVSIVATLLLLPWPAHANENGFNEWLQAYRQHALDAGISETVVSDALGDISEDFRVVRLDRKQPENKITLQRYLDNTITAQRIRTGKRMLEKHADLLREVSHRYGVQPKYIVALWAIESDFGNQMGNFSVVRSLATLAYEGRRAKFFSGELIAALKILEKENMASSELRGSWAGAMGNCQFMPSTYLAYAADGDGDGKRDIWNSVPDTFASIASYLHALNWDDSAEWGERVEAPEGFDGSLADITRGKTPDYWAAKGLNATRGGNWLYAIYPGKPDEGLYLITDNFKALLNWNRSRYFATAVGTLADAIEE